MKKHLDKTALFDSYLWQIQEQKLQYITQIMTGKHISRSCHDTDETVLSAAEVKAIATSNPLLAKKMEVDNEVTRLRILRGNWNNEKLSLERKIIDYYPNVISKFEKKIIAYKEDIITLKHNEQQDFKITIEDKQYNDKEKAGDALITALNVRCPVGEGPFPIGYYRGFELLGERKDLLTEKVGLCGKERHWMELGNSSFGNKSRLVNLAERIPEYLSESEKMLVDFKRQFKEAKEVVLLPFEHEDYMKEYIVMQSEINTKLEFKELSEADGVIMDEGAEPSIVKEIANEDEHDYEYSD